MASVGFGGNLGMMVPWPGETPLMLAVRLAILDTQRGRFEFGSHLTSRGLRARKPQRNFWSQKPEIEPSWFCSEVWFWDASPPKTCHIFTIYSDYSNSIHRSSSMSAPARSPRKPRPWWRWGCSSWYNFLGKATTRHELLTAPQ